MPNLLDDQTVRLAAFKWLEEQAKLYGDVLPRELLVLGFQLSGQRIPLISRQGIFKPRVLSEIPISITTTTKGPYSDRMGPDGLMLYSYRGTNPQHPDNAGLRKAMQCRTPLIYFHGLVPGRYLAVWPVYIVGDNQDSLEFTVAVDDKNRVLSLPIGTSQVEAVGEGNDLARRVYITSIVRQRLHQQSFRERVLEAYRQHCAICMLRHSELLDAAHIIPDNEPERVLKSVEN